MSQSFGCGLEEEKSRIQGRPGFVGGLGSREGRDFLWLHSYPYLCSSNTQYMSEHNFSKKSIVCTQEMTSAAKKVIRSLAGKIPGFSFVFPFLHTSASMFPLINIPECLTYLPSPLFLTAHPSGLFVFPLCLVSRSAEQNDATKG